MQAVNKRTRSGICHFHLHYAKNIKRALSIFFLLIQLVLVFSLLLHYQTLLTLTFYGLARL